MKRTLRYLKKKLPMDTIYRIVRIDKIDKIDKIDNKLRVFRGLRAK